MKKLFLLVATGLLAVQVQAQFTKASLQATGLTCAMCSNAINKALQVLPFIESVRSDIKNSAFNIQFKENAEVAIDDIKDAVEDAGFSIGKLALTGHFEEVRVQKDAHIQIGDRQFHFLNVKDKALSGEQTLTVVDKDFVTTKEFKKIKSLSKMGCVQTGKAAGCCEESGVASGTRIYHVTL